MEKRILSLVMCLAIILPMFCFGSFSVSANATSKENLALSATATASSSDGDTLPSKLNNGKNNGKEPDLTSYDRWTPKEKTTGWAQYAWDTAVEFDTIIVMEYRNNKDDYRATSFYLSVSDDGENFKKIHEGTTIGAYLEVKLDQTVKAKYLRIYLTGTSHSDPAVLREIEVYKMKQPEFDSNFVYDEDLTDNQTEAPAAWGAVPRAEQYAYAKQEICAFLHFSINTMTGREWGNRTEVVSDFNLTTEADFDGYVKLLKEAGFKRLIFTAKHHDGFCMWPSAYTDFDIEGTEYYKLYGDPLEAISAACTNYDMEMGLYLSPWDMHNPDYRNDPDSYVDYWVNQLHEIMNNPKYGCNGKWAEVWLDGACGEPETEYNPTSHLDVEKMYSAIYSHGKDILVSCLSKGGYVCSDIMLSGNEKGAASNDSWSKDRCGDDKFWDDHGTATEVSGYPAMPYEDGIRVYIGRPKGNHWMVIESDVSLTPGWFWGANKAIPKSASELRDIYYRSTGHNSVLLINIPLDNNGQVTPEIRTSVENFGKNIRDSFGTNLLSGARAAATTVHGDDSAYSAAKTIDGDEDTYYAAKEQNASLLYELDTPITFDAIRISEEIRLGQRVKSLTISYKNTNGNWIKWYEAPTIGSLRVAAGNPVTATAVKIDMVGFEESAPPIISEVGAYKVTSDFEVGVNMPDGLDVIDNAENSSEFAFSSGCTESNDINSVGGSYMNVPAGESVTVKFDGTFAYVYGYGDNIAFTVSVDGGAEQTFLVGDGGKLSRMIGETETVSEGTHTITIKTIDGNLKLDAVCALNNGSVGLVEFEHDSYYMSEDNTYDVKLVRKGGSTGTLNVIVNDEPGSAVQYHYVTTSGIPVTFADGETEKTVEISTQRYTEKTGYLDFSLKILPASGDTVFFGFNNTANVSIVDTETDFIKFIDSDPGYINKISLNKLPNKTQYTPRESPDISGIEVEADVYSAAQTRKTIYVGTTLGDNSSTEAEDHVKTIKFAAPISGKEFTMYTTLGASISEIEFYNSVIDPELSNNLAKEVNRTYQSSVHYWSHTECRTKKVIDGDRSQNQYHNRWHGATSTLEDANPWFRLVWDEGVTFDTIVIYEFVGSVADGKNNFTSDAKFVTSYKLEIGDGDVHFSKIVPEKSLASTPEYLTLKSKTVTVSYEGMSVSFDVNVESSVRSALVYDGFSVRVADYNGMRSVFYLDENVKNNGYTLKEYGTVAAATANKPSKGEFLTIDGDNITAANSKIIKTAVYKDGKIVNKTLDPDTDGAYAGITKFGFTITNFSESQYENKVFVCGYEVWVNDATGLTEIIYTEYSNPDYTDISIYDLSLGMYKAGVINSANEDGTVWNVLESGAVTLNKGSDYTVRDGMTDWNGNLIGDTFTYSNIPVVNQTCTDTVLSFSESGITVTLVKDGSDYTAIYRGEGELPKLSWEKTVQQLMPNFTEPSSSGKVSSVIGNSPAPIPTWRTSNKIKTIIFDNGITGVPKYALSINTIETIVYPKTLTSLRGEVFIGLKNLTTVFMAGTAPEVGLADISHVENVRGGHMFSRCSSLKKIHLPANISSIETRTFVDATSLDGIWCGDGEYKAGTVDLGNAVNCTAINNDAFNNVTNIKCVILSDSVTNIHPSAFTGVTGLTITQPTRNSTIESYCTANGYTYSYGSLTDTYTGTYNGRDYTVIKPVNANGNWVWRTEFLGAYDYADKALKNLGWTIAYYQVSNMYGNEESVELLKGFHDFVTAKFGLSEKADVFGFSRGGLYAVNYALKYPSDVSTLYLDAPVLNLWSWPAGLGEGEGDASCWNAVKAMYGVDEETVKTHTGNPILHASELISTEIPVILVAGDSDKTVPYSENGALLKKAYDDVGASANIKVIVKEGCDHHPHSLEDPTEIVNFVKANKSGFESGTDGNADAYSVANTFTLPIRPLENKTIFWLGSSETRGAYSVNNEAVPEYLAKRQNATSVKSGVDGATVFFDDTITNDGNRTSTHSFVTRIKSFDTSAAPDALVVCVSTNDAKEMYYSGKNRLGSVTGADKTALSDFDTSTTLGALEYIICYAKETWNCPVILHTSTSAGPTNGWFTAAQRTNYENIINALGDIETKWRVTVLDLYGDTEMNNVSDTLFGNYMHDPVHPLRLGYLKWWTPKFEACLETVLK